MGRLTGITSTRWNKRNLTPLARKCFCTDRYHCYTWYLHSTIYMLSILVSTHHYRSCSFLISNVEAGPRSPTPDTASQLHYSVHTSHQTQSTLPDTCRDVVVTNSSSNNNNNNKWCAVQQPWVMTQRQVESWANNSDGNALISAIATAALFPYFGWRLVISAGVCRKPSASTNIRNTWLIVCGWGVVVLLPWRWQWRLSPPSRHSCHDWPQCPPFIMTIILPIYQKCDSQRNGRLFRWRTVGFHV